MDAQRLQRIARRQHGLFHRAQARDCGFSTRQIQRRLEAGDWQPVLGAVLTAAGTIPTQRMRALAAPLAVSGSVLAGPTAARLWNIDVPDERLYLAVAPNHNP